MKESVVVVKWKGGTKEFITAITKFSTSNPNVDHISILGVKDIDSTRLHFFRVMKGDRLWNIAAVSEKFASSLWKMNLGLLGRFFFMIYNPNKLVITEDTTGIDLTDIEYQQKLSQCDYVQNVQTNV